MVTLDAHGRTGSVDYGWKQVQVEAAGNADPLITVTISVNQCHLMLTTIVAIAGAENTAQCHAVPFDCQYRHALQLVRKLPHSTLVANSCEMGKATGS